MNRWLMNFEYGVNVGADVFIYDPIATLVISLIAVSFQAVEAFTSKSVRQLAF